MRHPTDKEKAKAQKEREKAMKEASDDASLDAMHKEIERFMNRKVTTPADVEKRRKEREQEASMPKDKAPPAPRPKKTS